MNWLTNFIRPKIRSFVQKKDVPENLWHKCPSCEAMLFHRDLEKNLNVCYHCNHHMKINLKTRLENLFDNGDFTTVDLPNVPVDPLRFKDRKRYTDRLKEAQSRTGEKDALIIAKGEIGGQKCVIAAMNFDFMGGSMGAAVGSGILKAARLAVEENAAFITLPASGGARMQEGVISLMQMPRTILGVSLVKRAGLPYIVVLTNPTTGGVSASFAMVGDIHIAEPGAMIGFAGKRVIQETIREELPEDFQTAEYLLEHGMVDMVTARQDIPGELGRILNILMDKKQASQSETPENNNRSEPGTSSGANQSSSSGNGAAPQAKAISEKRNDAILQPLPVQGERQSLRDLMSGNLREALGGARVIMDPTNNNIRISWPDPSLIPLLGAGGTSVTEANKKSISSTGGKKKATQTRDAVRRAAG